MRREEGDALEAEYREHRAAVLGMLGKRFPRLSEDERLSLYHDSWARALAKRRRGERIESLRAYLLATAAAEALHSVTRGAGPIPLGPDDPRVAMEPDRAEPVDEQVVTRDQARIARDLLERLDRRQRDVLKLRWDLQLDSAEVRAALDLSSRQYRRLLEEGTAALAERVQELEGGEWSRRTRSLLLACLVEVERDGERRVGIASRRQRERARRLIESDPHAAALLAELRQKLRRSAALLPLPAVPVADEPALGRVLAVLADLRAQLASGLDTAKHQATSLYVRAADPTILTTPRPGAATLAIAATLATTTGAYGTYEALKPSPPATPPTAAPSSPAPVRQAAPIAGRSTYVMGSKVRGRPAPTAKRRVSRRAVTAKEASGPRPSQSVVIDGGVPGPSRPASGSPAYAPPPTARSGTAEFGFER